MKRTLQIKTIQLINQKIKPEQQIQLSPSPKHRMQRLDSRKEGITRTKISRNLSQSSRTKRESIDSSKTASRIHQYPEARINLKTQQTQRFLKHKKERYSFVSDQANIKSSVNFKCNAITNYDVDLAGQTIKRPLLKLSRNSQKYQFQEFLPTKHERIMSQPAKDVNMKGQIMRKISQKIDLMKKMSSSDIQLTEQNKLNESSSLFKFDRLYNHCLQKINKCISIYEKDLNKNKDKKYYELKIQGELLSRQLKQVRESLVRRKQQGEAENQCLGVVGNYIDVRVAQKTGSHRTNSSHFKRKIEKITKNIQVKAPFHPLDMKDMKGWQIRLEKGEQFYL